MAKQAKRTAIYYDEYPNCRIRERSENMKSNDLANELSKLAGETISPEAIRQWRGGYVRPDMSKIPAIAKALDCTSDYLFGIEDQPNRAASDIHAVTGLSDEAIKTLAEFVAIKDAATVLPSPANPADIPLSEIDILNKLLGDGDADDMVKSFFGSVRNYLALAKYEYPMVYITRNGSVFTNLPEVINATISAGEPFEFQKLRSDTALRNAVLDEIKRTLDIIAIRIYGSDHVFRSSYKHGEEIANFTYRNSNNQKITLSIGPLDSAGTAEDEQHEKEKE